jgi:hypothetical protein
MLQLPPRLLHRLAQLQRGKAVRRFMAAAADPEAAQTARLLDIVGRNAQTEYGRRFDFAGVRSPADYAERVPLVRYEDLSPYIQRSMQGERTLLTAEPPVHYVRTAGSSGAPKDAPITATYRAEFQTSLHMSLAHIYRRFPAGFQGKALYAVSALEQHARAPDGCSVGSMSGYNFAQMPAPVRAIYAWPPELFSLTDLRAQRLLALALAARQKVTLAGVVYPVTLLLLLRELQTSAGELARHARDGTVPGAEALTPDQRDFFAARLRPDRRTAARLDRAAADPAAAVPIALPDLRLVLCWTAATAGLYVNELQRLVGPQVAIRDAVYSASEGWMNSPLGDAEPGGPLALCGHYLEFQTEAEFLAGGTHTVPSHALEPGARYSPVLTTSAGLYRYQLGDIVECHGRWEGVPCIRFAYKAGATANLVSEKLTEAHVTQAMGPALGAAGLDTHWFCVAPLSAGTPPHYVCYLECAPGASVTALEPLATAIDRGLRAANVDYDRVRHGGALGPPRLRLIRPGSYAAWRQAQADAGAPVAQMKVAHLVDDPVRIPAALRAAVEETR